MSEPRFILKCAKGHTVTLPESKARESVGLMCATLSEHSDCWTPMLVDALKLGGRHG